MSPAAIDSHGNPGMAEIMSMVTCVVVQEVVLQSVDVRVVVAVVVLVAFSVTV